MLKNILLTFIVITCVACGDITLTSTNPPTGTVNGATKLGNPNGPQTEEIEKAVAGKVFKTSVPSDEGSEIEEMLVVVADTDNNTISIFSDGEETEFDYAKKDNSIVAEDDKVKLDITLLDDILDINLTIDDNISKVVESITPEAEFSFDWLKEGVGCANSVNKCYDNDDDLTKNRGMYLVSGHVQRGDNCELTINDYCEGDYAFDIACDDNTKTASNYQKVRKAKCDVCVRGKCQSQVEFVVGEEFILIDDICATHPSACKKTKTVKDLITETGTDDHIEDMGPGVDALKFGSN